MEGWHGWFSSSIVVARRYVVVGCCGWVGECSHGLDNAEAGREQEWVTKLPTLVAYYQYNGDINNYAVSR